MIRPLEGITILDLSSILMVPYCTRILADLGADVIKIESLEGDNTRYIGPYENKSMGAVFLNLNRNKKSVSVDLKTLKGKEIIFKLIKKSDVFISNIRKSALSRLGFDHKTFVKYNDKIISAFAVGFSSDGPYRDLPAYDDIIQAASGMASYQEAYSDQPSYTSGATADKATGLMLALSVVSSLFKRNKDNKDLELEVPMFETMVDFTLVEHLYGYNFLPPKDEPVYPRQSSPNRKPYKTKDGFIAVLPYNDEQWLRFLKFIKKEYLIKTKKFSTLENRNKNVDELYSIPSEIDVDGLTTLNLGKLYSENLIKLKELKKEKTNFWIKKLREIDIPSMRVNKPKDLFIDEHLKKTNFFKTYKHSTEGDLMYPRLPVYFNNERDNESKFEAPNLGNKTKEILIDLGYDKNEIENLRKEKVIFFE